ncbi:hypothetical protein ACWD01_27180 [Streptomyces sp. NPDC002835]
MVHPIPRQGVRLKVRLVSRRDHYVGLWVYDDQVRRTDELIDHRLVTRKLLARYRGSDPGSPW